jgi:hypothetical protein
LRRDLVALAPAVSKVQVFVSFDVEHDADLYELLLAQAASPSSGFAVAGRSEPCRVPEVWSERVRHRIGQADQVIFICGEHTDASTGVGAELRIAREEGTPFFLLWGRREIMCTKPFGARSLEGMYNWTSQILRQQIAVTLRSAH